MGKLVICLVGFFAISFSVFADNNIDVVNKCLKKEKYQLDAVELCAKEKLVSSALPEKKADWIRIETWQLDKKVDYDQSRRFIYDFESKKNKEFFCGFKAIEEENVNAEWSVFDVYDKGATAFARLKGKGTFRDAHPSALKLSVQGRWLPKEAAGNLKENIYCNGDGWSMKPFPKGDIRELMPKACINYVKICEAERENEKPRMQICGICSEQSSR